MYKYRAKLLKVVDGDTLDLLIDLGFSVHTKQRVRLFGIDTPESRTKDLREKVVGLAAKWFTKNYLKDYPLEIASFKQGKYGRYLVIVYPIKNGNALDSLNNQLLLNGLAYPYFGGNKQLIKPKF